jgi:hypothetical protein
VEKSEKIQAVWNELSPKCDNLNEAADAECSPVRTGADRAFKDGYQLAKKAGNKSVWHVTTWTVLREWRAQQMAEVALFFIGTEDEVTERLRAFVAAEEGS